MTREEALQWLADLIRTPIGSVGKDSPLVQAYEEDSEGNVKVRLADKIAGFQTLVPDDRLERTRSRSTEHH